jgi:peptidyl-prolyl cis-trans isomerase C
VKKASVLILAVLLSIGIAVAQEKKAPAANGQAATPAAQAQADPVVITYGGKQVRQSEFEAAIDTLPPEYRAVAAGPAKRGFAEEYVRMRILADEAEKAGLDKDPAVRVQLQLMRENTLANAQLERIQESITVPEAALQKAYEEQKNNFERARARHILIAFTGSPAAQAEKPALTEAQARARAEELRKQIVAGGDFAELARTESDDTVSGSRGGDLGEFGRGDMVPEFDHVVFEAPVGEVSQPVRTQFGYHLVQVQERSARPLAEVRPQLEGRIKQQQLQDRIEALKNSANVTFNESYFPAEDAADADPHAGHDH